VLKRLKQGNVLPGSAMEFTRSTKCRILHQVVMEWYIHINKTVLKYLAFQPKENRKRTFSFFRRGRCGLYIIEAKLIQFNIVF